jgi:hypothetical protein
MPHARIQVARDHHQASASLVDDHRANEFVRFQIPRFDVRETASANATYAIGFILAQPCDTPAV